MHTSLSFSHFNARRWHLLLAVIVLLLMLIGTLLALVQHLPTDANEQGIHSGLQAFLMNGTVISPPTVLMALFIVCMGLAFGASRGPLVGLIGTLGVTLLCLIALLATTSDANWRQLLSPAHFDLLLSPLALLSSGALLLTALFGIVSGVQQISVRRRKG